MTKIFASAEELNRFLNAGKVVSKIAFENGAICATYEELTDSVNRRTLKDYITEIEEGLDIHKGKSGKYLLSDAYIVIIAAYTSSFPRNIGKAVLLYFIENDAGISDIAIQSAWEAFNPD